MTVRLCGDYKVTVNPVLEDNVYPLPTAEDLFAKMGGAKVFTKLDLSNAYLQLELTDRSKPLQVINTHKGLYEYQRLSFGIATAPSIFQSIMDQVLQGIPGAESLLDDILIGIVTDDQHDKVLHEVLKRLDTYGIKVNLDKCKFKVPKVEYLGHCIDGDGLHPLEDKIKAIEDAPHPENVTQLRAFLGMIKYYGRFLGNMSTILAPLYSLLKADTPWKWNSEQEDAFQKCKTMLSSESVLVHYDLNKPLTLACDASAYGVGCVLSHVMNDGTERPVAFASRTLSPSEKNYAQIEKEALAIIYGVKKFHKYIYGRKFVLITDHKPLTTLLGPKNCIPTLAAARLQRWAPILMAHDYEIRYRRSEDHANADGLSRLPGNDDPETIEAKINYFSNVINLPVSAIAQATRKDPVLARVMDYTMSGWPNYVADEGLAPFFRRKDELSVDQDCLLWGLRVIIPKSYQDYVLNELHSEHMGIVKMKARARSYVWYPGLDHDIEMTAKSCTVCQSLQNDPPVAPLHPWKYPQRIWERVHVDFAEFQSQHYFVLIDSRSKWIEAILMTSTTAEKTVETLRKIFSSYGLPEELVSDNGPQFTAEIFKDFMKNNGIKHSLSPPYNPSSNGAAERSVQVIKSALKKHMMSVKLNNGDKSTRKHLANFLLTYRSTPHSVTGRTPVELFLGRQVRTRLSLLKPDLRKTVEAAQEKQKQFHDNSITLREFEVNESCRVRNYRESQDEKWIPGRVVKRLGQQRYLVQTGARTRYVHVNQMLPSVGHADEELRLSLPNALPLLPVTTGNTIPTEEETTQRKLQPALKPASNLESRERTLDKPVTSTNGEPRRYPQRTRKQVQRLDL
ncbi:uncharacterized protein K02A2.6-like [Haliotis rufescens]|uniref:uncharacterized protein K02A2.6-like n=1 Tax=Haliotis rufescens TaxID=6454 RepID=UPI00201F2D0B|nr:uncharacterized protein K02A2.6-like [Haliotis rufescens]